MSEAARIADQLRRAHRGEAWHGPSVREVLEGVTAAQAAKRGIGNAHTIWELVLHVERWARAAREALDGTPMPAIPYPHDWPPVGETTAEAWSASRAQLDRTLQELADAVENLPEEKLRAMVPGRDYTFYFLWHGVVQHNLYHAGQIALLKKL